MVDASNLTDAIVLKLKAIAALVALLGGDASVIVPYYPGEVENNNLEQTVIDMKAPGLMVAWGGTRTGQFAKGDAIKHDFSIFVAYDGKISALFVALRDGIPTGETLKFKHLTIDPGVNPPEDMACAPKTKFISPQYGLFDFTEITFTLTERGADT